MSDSHEHAGFIAPEPADLAPLFPGYEIQSLIATGGMGAVYRAVQKSLDRTVALKILPMEFSKDAAFCAGFEAEAKAMARLNHPNLIGVYDFGEVNGMLFIIMEYVPGKSVYHSAYGKAIDPKEVIRLVTGICDGLAHAHENGIIHRDIKPSNILLDHNAQPKIGDFGLARPVERKVEEGEEIFGTPHYTAPEVVNAPRSVDYRADIFSVGVLLHELLTSKLPANDPRPASTIVRCDSRFDAIIRRATQPLAAARYSSAAEISRDLQAIAASLTQKVARVGAAAPRPPTPVRRPVRVKKSSSSPMLGAFAVLVVLAIAAVFFLSKKPAPKAPPSVVVVPLTKTAPPTPKPLDSSPVPTTPEPTPSPAEDADSIATEPLTPVPEETTESPIEETSAAPETAVAKFDVSAFFDYARNAMRKKAVAPLANYRTNLKTNFSEFGRAVEKQTRKLKISGSEEADTITTTLAEMEETGVIPKILDSEFAELEGVPAIHKSCLVRQTGIQDTLNESLAQLSGTYILGLELKIKQLKDANDPGAVALIEEEIEKTKDSPEYFSELMLGNASEEASSDDE
jgi:serine/threonine protein kinase